MSNLLKKNLKNITAKVRNLAYFKQKINYQIIQAFATLNGITNILGTASYVAIEDYYFAIVQFIFGVVFLIISYGSYNYKKHRIAIQWLFFFTMVFFVSLNSLNDFDANGYVYYIPLAMLAVITSHRMTIAVSQTSIVLIALMGSYALRYSVENGSMYNMEAMFQIIDSASTMVSAILLNTVIMLILSELYRKSEDKVKALLLKALPEIVVNEIQENGSFSPKKINKVAVLFLDFVSFTTRSSKLEAGDLLTILNRYFLAFEETCREHQVEKIKTLGDGYMAVAGAPNFLENPAHSALCAAKDILQKMDAINKKENLDWEVRIGLHVGPVITGIAGDDKYLYDIWGDTVNIAARMEQNSKPMRIAISETFYQEFDELDVDDLGFCLIKGKGDMRILLVK